MKNFCKILSLCSILIIPTLGIAAETPFLDNYDKLRPGKFLDAYYVSLKSIHEIGYSYIAVKDVDTTQIKQSWGMAPEEAGAFLKREMEVASVNHEVGRFFNFESTEGAPAVLEMAITEQSSGNIVGRMLAPLGWGQAYLRIEGRIRDTRDDRIIASFSQFAKSKAIFPLRDLGFSGGVNLLKEMFKGSGEKIIQELGNDFGYIPETLKDNNPFKYS